MTFKPGDVILHRNHPVSLNTVYVVLGKVASGDYQVLDIEVEMVMVLDASYVYRGMKKLSGLWCQKRYKSLICNVNAIIATHLATEARKLNRGQL